MSLISSAFDAMVARVETVLDASTNNYTRLPNPYIIEDNTELKLKKGYGIALLSGTNTNRQVNCKFSVNRTMEVILTRLYTGNEENAVTKASLEKLLFEDQYKIIKDFEQDITINGQTMYTRWESDNGIEFVTGTTGRFYVLKTQFALEYLESF
jgi:hypothetical protein